VEYYNHACAEHARRVMSKPSFRLGNNAPTISWADPRSGPDASAMSQVCVVCPCVGLCNSWMIYSIEQQGQNYSRVVSCTVYQESVDWWY
jgi:hypothetical protein